PRARGQIPVGACTRSQAGSGRASEDRGKTEGRSARRNVLAGKGRQEEWRRRLVDAQRQAFRVSAPLSERAFAKINLTLRVLGRRADGYHALASLVAFAAVHDACMIT